MNGGKGKMEGREKVKEWKGKGRKGGMKGGKWR